MNSTVQRPPLSSLSSMLSSVHAQNGSAASTTLREDTAPAHDTSPYITLALQIQHNLQYQQSWTSLELHTHSPASPHPPFARPILSGLPPTRLYVHPDQQARELAAQQKAGKDANGELNVRIEREWVLPAHLSEKWSLRRLAEIFDALPDAAPQQNDDVKDGLDQDAGQPAKRVLLATLSDDSTVNYYIVHDGIVKPRQN